MPFPEVWKGFFFVCLNRPIFLKIISPISNWSTLLSDLMASSILELAVGWISSVGCTQPVVNLYTSCQGRSTRSTTDWRFLWLNDWAITEGKRLSYHGGQCTFGVSEGVAPAPYSATRFRGWGEGKERQKHSDLSRINVEESDLEFRHLQRYSIEGQSFLYCRQVSLPLKYLRVQRG